MSMIPRFPYMPPGSFNISYEGKITYYEEIPEDLRNRFEADVAKKLEEQRERHKRGLFRSTDI